jgi:imidazolonepropionase
METFIKNIGQLITVNTYNKNIKIGKEMQDLGIIENAALLIEDSVIKWFGKESDFNFNLDDSVNIIDACGYVIMPGFVDSHTHILFLKGRENEFALRAKGFTYQQIAENGGGILSTVKDVRVSDKRQLKKSTDKRLDEILSLGTTTVEIKSGYGLNFKNEIKMLEAINELNDENPIDIIPTFLGAHAIPNDTEKEKYIDEICNNMIPYVAEKKLSRFCDVFCEKGYFSIDDTKKILEKAKEFGLIPKLHAEELSYTGGVELACELNAISVDHLENISNAGIDILSKSDTIGVLLPGVSFYLNHKYAPARQLIDSGAKIAISSDYNPGSCMTGNMQLIMTIAITQMHISIEEAICASTINGAAALGVQNFVGSIEIGKKADLVIYKINDYKSLPYHFGINHVYMVIKNGNVLQW